MYYFCHSNFLIFKLKCLAGKIQENILLRMQTANNSSTHLKVSCFAFSLKKKLKFDIKILTLF